MHKYKFSAAILAGVLICTAAFAQRYTILDLGLLPGFASSRGLSINNHGQVVGALDTSNWVTHAFFWKDGMMTDLGTFGGSESLACSINNAGDISGAWIRDGELRAFLLRQEQMLDLGLISHSGKLGGNPEGGCASVGFRLNDAGQGVLWREISPGVPRSFFWDGTQLAFFGIRGDGSRCDASALNNRGQIVGQFVFQAGQMHAYLWQDGQVLDLGTLGGPGTYARAINDHGMVAGFSGIGDGTSTVHAFVWEKGVLTDIGALGGKLSRAYAVNNAGQVVGYLMTTNDEAAAFLWEKHHMSNLNDLIPTNSGWRLICADAINDRGQILALGKTNGQFRACLLFPRTPLPRSGMPRVLPTVPIRPRPLPNAPSDAMAPAVPFSLESFNRLANGHFELIFRGNARDRYRIEASTNLVTWETLGEAANNNGLLHFIDPGASGLPLRFYRATRSR